MALLMGSVDALRKLPRRFGLPLAVVTVSLALALCGYGFWWFMWGADGVSPHAPSR